MSDECNKSDCDSRVLHLRFNYKVFFIKGFLDNQNIKKIEQFFTLLAQHQHDSRYILK